MSDVDGIDGAHDALVGARDLSRELVAAAERGDVSALARLDAERLHLLESFRLAARSDGARSDGARHHTARPDFFRRIGAADWSLLQEISVLNDRALGLVEHHRRIKGRAMDMAAVGRRAVVAYKNAGFSGPGNPL